LAEENNLRVSFIAGGLGKGGAEKQFLYMLRALMELKVRFQVITLTQGEYYEAILQQMGIRPIYIGSNPAARVINIQKAAHSFRPHFIQASHFFASFYAGMAGRLSGVPSIGAIRNDFYHDLQGIGKIGPWLLWLPSVLLANSWKARENAAHLGLSPKRVFVLHNVIDLEDFDRRITAAPDPLFNSDRIYAVTVARLVPFKRLERFLAALSLARLEIPQLVGLIIGDGPSAPELRALAESLDLKPGDPSGAVRFLGERNDIPYLLKQANLFILTSDQEGFPNVLLEAMAASLPILTTPAGETRDLVADGFNGYFVPYDDPPALAQRMIELAQSPALRKRMGTEGRRIVERQYSYPRLKSNLVDTYHAIAKQVKNGAVLSILEKGTPLGKEKINLFPERRNRF
jgi:glycosyltransferase involved in cell wall biosynthesis